MIDANKLIKKFEDAGKEWAESQAEFRRLEDLEKPILAEIIGMVRPECTSHAEAEASARSHPKHMGHLEKKAAARLAYGLATANYEKVKIYIEMMRSNQAYKRTEMGLL